MEKNEKKNKKRSWAGDGKRSVEPGYRGFLVSCNRKMEQKANNEALRLLKEYSKDTEEIALEAPEDFEKELEVERQKLRETSNNFTVALVMECLSFIKSKESMEPVEILKKILNDLEKSGEKRTKFIHRIVPIEMTVDANISQIKQGFINLFKNKSFDNYKTFSIVFKSRQNNTVVKGEVIEMVHDELKKLHPDLKVDLEAPDVVLIVEVFKGICGISLVEDFYKLRKFNLEEIFACKENNK